MPGQDKDALLNFFDYVSEKGLMKKPTAQTLKSACNKVFDILEEREQSNIFALDLDEVFRRFENLNSTGVTPVTMQAYRRRVRQAVSDFERFNADPSSWKPSAAQRQSTSGKRSPKSGAAQERDVDSLGQQDLADDEQIAVEHIIHQFPLRSDVIVSIRGIPFDVTRAEMGRMTAFLSNLVAETETAATEQLMLKEAKS